MLHRLIYKVVNEPVTIDDTDYEGTVEVIRMGTHYGGDLG